MLKLYIMCGLAFSGKSTLAQKMAEHIGCPIIAFDKLWTEKDREKSIPKDARGWRFIRRVAQERISRYLKVGTSVVYDDNNPKLEHRDELRRLAEGFGAKSVVVYLETPLTVVRAREKANKISQDRHEVEPKNFQKVLEDLEVPTKVERTLVFTPETDVEDFLEKLN